jgi:hypothetical protein
MPHREHLRNDCPMRVSAVLLLSLLGSSVALAAPKALSADRPVVLVTDVVVVGEGPIGVEAATATLTRRFARLNEVLEVRSMVDARAKLDAAAVDQMMGSDDDGLAVTGKYLQVSRLVLTRIAVIGGITEVQMRLFNTEDASTEVAFGRRIRAGTDPSLVLAALDVLADRMAVWLIDAYGDGGPSEAFEALANKKLTPKDKAGAPTKFGWLGLAGGLIAGAGLGAIGGGITAGVVDSSFDTVDIAAVGVGGVALLLGGTAVIVDAGE